jgi:hypothetical protein
MGREARITATLTREQQQERQSKRAGKAIPHIHALEQALATMGPNERGFIYARIKPNLSFRISPAEDRWLQRRWRAHDKFRADWALSAQVDYDQLVEEFNAERTGTPAYAGGSVTAALEAQNGAEELVPVTVDSEQSLDLDGPWHDAQKDSVLDVQGNVVTGP